MSILENENNNKDNNFFEGLGNIYGSVKDTVWGKAVPQMSKDAGGFYDTSFWDPSQWQQFGSKGGTIGNNGQLYNADGSAFDASSIGGNLKGLGSTTEGGLGSIFSGETMGKVKDVAGTAGSLFNIYNSVSDIFGSVAKSRFSAVRRLGEGYRQNSAMNQMAMDKFREDNAHFKQQRSDITASYNA